MKFEEYHERTGDTAEYPQSGSGGWLAVSYVGLGLAGEAGEIANQLKKVLRDDHGRVMGERKLKLADEIGDVFWYLSRLCRELRIDPEYVMAGNIRKLQGRAADGTLHGDRREEFGTHVHSAYETWVKTPIEVSILPDDVGSKGFSPQAEATRQSALGKFPPLPDYTEEDLADAMGLEREGGEEK